MANLICMQIQRLTNMCPSTPNISLVETEQTTDGKLKAVCDQEGLFKAILAAQGFIEPESTDHNAGKRDRKRDLRRSELVFEHGQAARVILRAEDRASLLDDFTPSGEISRHEMEYRLQRINQIIALINSLSEEFNFPTRVKEDIAVAYVDSIHGDLYMGDTPFSPSSVDVIVQSMRPNVQDQLEHVSTQIRQILIDIDRPIEEGTLNSLIAAFRREVEGDLYNGGVYYNQRVIREILAAYLSGIESISDNCTTIPNDRAAEGNS